MDATFFVRAVFFQDGNIIIRFANKKESSRFYHFIIAQHFSSCLKVVYLVTTFDFPAMIGFLTIVANVCLKCVLSLLQQ